MNIRKIIVFYCCLIYILIPSPVYAQKTPSTPCTEKINVDAKGAVLIEADSLRVLWEKNSNTPLPMASTTKIMTCIVALEQGNLTDVVTASKRAAAAPRVKLHLQPGEKQLLGDLLYALMLESSNDAAVAIAEHVGGSVETFCEMMTTKARQIGATTATFKTPNGLDAAGHMASAYDLALIAQYAYKIPKFLEIIHTPSKNIPSVQLKGSRSHALINKNRFLNSYGGANGVKTGFTSLAGHCFVGGAKKDDMQLFAVALASGWGAKGRSQKYVDVIRLMNYGFANYKKVSITKEMDIVAEIPVIRGEQKTIPLAYGKSVLLPLTDDEKENISIAIDIPENIKAPTKKYEPVGKAIIYIDQTITTTLPIVAADSVDQKTIQRSFVKTMDQWIRLILQ